MLVCYRGCIGMEILPSWVVALRGLHNILEAACYGIPVFFGDQAYQKFPEAVDLAEQEAFPIHDLNDINEKFRRLHEQPGALTEAAKVTRQYVEKNLGATDKIVRYCKTILQAWKAVIKVSRITGMK